MSDLDPNSDPIPSNEAVSNSEPTQESNVALNYVYSVVEAILFVSDKPVMFDEIKEVVGDVEGRVLRQAIAELKAKYETEKRGMVIVEIAGGYQMLSNPDYANAVRAFYRTQKKEKLSKPALESLAIVAYKQPVTRLDIELIRGVNSDGVVAHLLEKNLIKIAGRKDVPGKPFMYGTTKEFLEYFGLRSLSDLPKLEDFASLQEEGSDSIKAFQGISEEFKQQAAEYSPSAEKVLPLEAEDAPSIAEEGAQELPQTSEAVPGEGGAITEEKKSEAAVNEGGTDEHPQAA